MNKRGIYLQLYKRAPAPNRDYYGLTITKSEVILNIWNISYGPHVFPKKQKCHLEDFPEDRIMNADIERLFGKHVVEYCEMLSRCDPKLECLPTKIFLYILRYLATNDILNLGQSSKIFFELCNRESAWKLIFKKRNKKRLMPDDIEQAEVRGWRNVLLTNVLLQESTLFQTKRSVKKSTKLKSEQLKDIHKSLITDSEDKYLKNKNTNSGNNRLKKNEMTDMHKITNLVPDRKKIPFMKKSTPVMLEHKPNLPGQNSGTINPFVIPKFEEPGKYLKPFTVNSKESAGSFHLNNAKIVNESKYSINNKVNIVKRRSSLSIINNMGDFNDIPEKNVNISTGVKTNSSKRWSSVKFK